MVHVCARTSIFHSIRRLYLEDNNFKLTSLFSVSTNEDRQPNYRLSSADKSTSELFLSVRVNRKLTTKLTSVTERATDLPGWCYRIRVKKRKAFALQRENYLVNIYRVEVCARTYRRDPDGKCYIQITIMACKWHRFNVPKNWNGLFVLTICRRAWKFKRRNRLEEYSSVDSFRIEKFALSNRSVRDVST